jgi:hypothetical protein
MVSVEHWLDVVHDEMMTSERERRDEKDSVKKVIDKYPEICHVQQIKNYDIMHIKVLWICL